MKSCILFALLCTSFKVFSQDLDLEVFTSGFSTPTTITNAGDNRLFICEKAGEIKIINADGSVENNPFLDISGQVSNGSEQGLLGLAFHPNYTTNGKFYIHYTNTAGDTVISQYQRSTATTANATSELILLTISQPFANHNGGNITFGPDNKLYISIGDGGSRNDPQRNSQNTTNLLGTILRLDVDLPAPYIPIDNPFVGQAGQDAIWAYGLRNPYKFSFDGNNLWIADVGDNIRGGDEEINRAIGNPPALNYGWRCFEGYDSRNNDSECNGASLTTPIDTYNRNETPRRCSVTGGFVYRGTQHPGLVGKYIFGDFCSKEVFLIDPANIDADTNTSAIQAFGPFDINITTFGIDANNELYVGGRNNTGNSTIYRVIDTNTTLSFSNFDHLGGEFIFPNPAASNFKIEIEDRISSVQLFNLKGSLIKKFSHDEITNKRFNINAINSGPYILLIKTIGNKELRQKLIVK